MLKLRFFIGVISMGISFFVSADHTFKPYIGVDMQQRNMNFVKNYGNNVFAQKSLQSNIYMGLSVSEHFGFEMGYQSSQKSSKKAMILGGEYILGQVTNPTLAIADTTPFIVTETSIRTQGPHLSGIGIFSSKDKKIDFMASLGFTLLTVKLSYKQLADSDLAGYTLPDLLDTTRNFSSTRVIPRCMFGVQRHLTESLGLRASLVYEFTQRFQKMVSKDVSRGFQLPGNGALRASLRNSITYGLGVFMNF